MRGPRTWLFSALLLVGGCGGEYLLAGPDAVARSGQQAPVVVRVQRREFWFHCPAVADAAVTFTSPDGLTRCARTDGDGYAAVAFPAGDKPGATELSLHLQDHIGRSVTGRVRLFALSPDEPLAAVDLDALPGEGQAGSEATAALGRVAAGRRLVYFTQDCAAEPERARQRLTRANLPDGPVIPWRKQSPWYARSPFGRPRECPAAAFRGRFENLTVGICADAAAAERFSDAGLNVVLIGDAPVEVNPITRFASWAEVRLEGLARE